MSFGILATFEWGSDEMETNAQGQEGISLRRVIEEGLTCPPVEFSGLDVGSRGAGLGVEMNLSERIYPRKVTKSQRFSKTCPNRVERAPCRRRGTFRVYHAEGVARFRSGIASWASLNAPGGRVLPCGESSPCSSFCKYVPVKGCER